ncbi:MAG: zinc-binding dehydrogenase, partial [Candidatus Zixiibacteriota bacterium]
GISGLLHLALARALGAGRIIATDINDYRLKAAKDFGADVVLHASEDIPARLREANDGRLADLVIICAGFLSVFSEALRCVDRGGTVLFFAPTDPGVELPVPVNDFWRNGITLLPSYGAAPLDCVQAIELIRSRRVPVAKMITHRLPLEQTALGFKLVEEAKESIKVIIEPQKPR